MAKRTQGNLHDTRLVDGLVLDAALTSTTSSQAGGRHRFGTDVPARHEERFEKPKLRWNEQNNGWRSSKPTRHC